MFAKAVGTVVVAIGFLIFVSFLLSWPVYMLWNGCLVDAIEGVKEVTWLQAWGLMILAGFLFKTTVTSKE
jgi:hypothetical protein